jgi:hypothetical protein
LAAAISLARAGGQSPGARSSSEESCSDRPSNHGIDRWNCSKIVIPSPLVTRPEIVANKPSKEGEG